MQDWKIKDQIDEKNAEDKNGSANAFERRLIINFVHTLHKHLRQTNVCKCNFASHVQKSK